MSLVLTMMSVAGYAQSVIGKWITEGGDSQVKIYQSGDKLDDKIVWLKEGDRQLDVHNPDKLLGSGNCRNCAGSGTNYIGSSLKRCSICGSRGRCTTCSGQGGRYIKVYR